MKRKNETVSQLVVGAFMVVLMVLLAYFTIVVSGVDLISGRSRRAITVAFNQVGGLKERDNVMFRGTKVGTVEHVSITPSNLVVTAMVDEGVVLRTGYVIKVCNLSMLGGNYLLLEEGEGEPIDCASGVLKGETPNDWMQDVANISKRLNELVSKPELHAVLTNLAAASAKANAFMDRAQSVATKADTFMDSANSVAVKTDAFMDNATVIATNVNTLVARLERGEGTAGKLLSGDETLYTDLKAGVAAFRQAAEGFDAKTTMEKANRLLDNLNAVAADLKDGKGTLGRLVNDPKLYEEVDGLIRDVRQVLDNFRDTTPISTFSSLAVGAF